tara:strand:+ start:1506 stop:3179 length:1674 start_codon:yes stop_codon:yes gene_type:complete
VAKTSRPKKIAPPKNDQQFLKMLRKGERLYGQTKYQEALAILNTAWGYREKDPYVLALLARCLIRLGERKKALDLLSYALTFDLENSLACDILGNAALDMNMPEVAEKFFKILLQVDPENIGGYNNLASTWRDLHQYDEAIALLQNILPAHPEESSLWNTLATVVSERDGVLTAEPFYLEALRLAPNDYRINNNLMGIHRIKEEYDDAIAAAQRAIKAAPQMVSPHLGLSSTYLLLGELEKGWEEYDWRNNAASTNAIRLPYDVPHWQGEPLSDKTLFISAEQGVGDEILFAMMYPALLQEAKKLIIGVDPRLVPLYKNSFPTADITPYVTQNIEGRLIRHYPETDVNNEADFITLCGSIPRYRMATTDAIPRFHNGYLTASDAHKQQWAARISKLPHKMSIGISWRSGKVTGERLKHYSSLSHWQDVLKVKNVNFINVQYGDCAAEINDFTERTGLDLHNFEDLDLRNDFENTAALMQNLDLVIGPASSPQMQAMSAGTPTWWLSIDKPWWLYGQKQPVFAPEGSQVIIKNYEDGWQTTLTNVAQMLQKYIATHKG